MIDNSRELERGSSRPDPVDDSRDAVFSLKPLFVLLASSRRVIGIAVVSAIALCVTTLLLLMLVLPSEHTGSLQVRLLFDGAADGHYPNGTAFSPAEIVATPILSEVYRINDLQRFGRYDDFKESFTVLQASLEQELLAASYSARLSDSKLSPTDRARLEDEFRKRLAAIKDPVYALTMRRNVRLSVMPAALVEKVLNDTLAAWARQAKDLKGGMRYNVPVVSADILSSGSLDKDFLVAADDLRLQARRAADIAQQLLSVPGASGFRSEKDHVSLSDVAFALSDLLRTEIEPLVYSIQQEGWATDPRATQAYVRDRVAELRLQRDANRARIQTLQDALQGYMSTKGAHLRDGAAGTGTSGRAQGPDTQTLIPQLSDTFLDRIIEMSTQTQASDVAYRQDLAERLIREGAGLSGLDRDTAYYEQLEKIGRPGVSPITPDRALVVKRRLQTAFESVQAQNRRLVTVYEELSEQRLNPTATLYAVSRPFTVSTRYAVTWTTAGLCLALAVLLALMGAPIWCAYHQYAARRAAVARD